MNNYVIFFLLILLTALGCQKTGQPSKKLLIFSKTEGFRHTSIEPGKRAIVKMAADQGYQADTSEDASVFENGNLKNYAAIIFLNTTGDCLNDRQQIDMMRYIQAGGGFVGIHSAADTEYKWPWYGRLVGAYFNGHPNNPNVREATIIRLDSSHISCRHLPDEWHRSDEWYNYRDIQPDLNLLLNLDETSYEGGTNGANHPIAWYHDFDGGRAFYTGGGHTDESFSEEAFMQHLWGGIVHAAGDGILDYSRPSVVPEENRFQKVVLDDNLNEPMELVMLPDRRLMFIERKGAIYLYDPQTDSTRLINQLEVYTKHEDGLLGLALDPDFAENHWLYLFYSPPGDEPKQHVSRFDFVNDKVDISTEKVLLEIATQRDECCHSGGCLEFGREGHLFISVGDNTNPFASDGYSPSDERPGRSAWDAQKSSSNTGDLRGKILRIKPEPDGTYSIPDGNLFPRDGSEGRPEIYVMGCRNPFRVSIDHRTGYLYWGDVGPDAGKDSVGRGPKGHDEVNQARKAGFFGWPYFVGDNKPYYEYDFARKRPLAKYDAEYPVNNSPNNTGIQNLPPAQPAFIWYPYDESLEFPLVGTGGRNAMAGPVFYLEDYPESDARFPAYYDKKLFTYDWIRGWMMAITMDDEGDFLSMERFLPSQKFSNPMDIIMSPDGDMYMLEYGTAWFARNPDARLVHLKFIEGNRQPIAKVQADELAGANPLQVQFSSEGTFDPDGDDLKYLWTFGEGEGTSREMNPSYTYTKPGHFTVRLTVTDADNLVATDEIRILAGNEPPALTWNINGNQSFYWPGREISYDLTVSDQEDGTVGNGIDADAVALSINYLAQGMDINEISMGHEALATASRFIRGKNLIEQSDCKACHFIDRQSVGPTYQDIAGKYREAEKASEYLADKIINGGGGVWGVNAMAAHPQHTVEEAQHMVDWILSLADLEKAGDLMPLAGTYRFDETNDHEEGSYILMASYTDRGAEGLEPLTSRELIRLRSPKFSAAGFDTAVVASTYTLTADQASLMGSSQPLDILIATPGGYVGYNDLDLTGIIALDITATSNVMYTGGGTINVHIDSPQGEVIGTAEVAKPTSSEVLALSLPLKQVEGKHDLYLVFSGSSDQPVAMLVTLEFRGADPL